MTPDDLMAAQLAPPRAARAPGNASVAQMFQVILGLVGSIQNQMVKRSDLERALEQVVPQDVYEANRSADNHLLSDLAARVTRLEQEVQARRVEQLQAQLSDAERLAALRVESARRVDQVEMAAATGNTGLVKDLAQVRFEQMQAMYKNLIMVGKIVLGAGGGILMLLVGHYLVH